MGGKTINALLSRLVKLSHEIKLSNRAQSRPCVYRSTASLFSLWDIINRRSTRDRVNGLSETGWPGFCFLNDLSVLSLSLVNECLASPRSQRKTKVSRASHARITIHRQLVVNQTLKNAQNSNFSRRIHILANKEILKMNK